MCVFVAPSVRWHCQRQQPVYGGAKINAKKNRTQKRYTNTEPECTEQQQIQGGANKCKRPSLYLQVQQPQQLRN